MMDIVDRLRHHARHMDESSAARQIYTEAAEEIERLRAVADRADVGAEIKGLLDDCWISTPCMVRSFEQGKDQYVPGKVHHLDYHRVKQRIERLMAVGANVRAEAKAVENSPNISNTYG